MFVHVCNCGPFVEQFFILALLGIILTKGLVPGYRYVSVCETQNAQSKVVKPVSSFTVSKLLKKYTVKTSFEGLSTHCRARLSCTDCTKV